MKKRGFLLVLTFVLLFSMVAFADGRTATIKPLVILMDFQDYSHDTFADREEKSHQTGDAYDSYEKDLYETLFFGDDTYVGPDGGEYITFRNYFKQLTNKYYITDGDVYGWYTASMNAEMYGGDQNGNGSDQDEAKLLVQEALGFVAQEENVDLSQYDRMDPNDIDNDGKTNEPDGEIDVVIVIHAGRGEEWGGGTLGEDAIWPFRIGFDWYYLGEKYEVNYGDQKILSNDFLVFEQDFPMGLATHEFSHYLSLPDLYNYNGDSPVQTWSNMGGSYAGAIPGSLPPNVGAYGRYLLAAKELANAVNLKVYSLTELAKGKTITLSAAADQSSKKTNLVKIELPQKETVIVEPVSGSQVYYSKTGNWLTQEMSTTLDLSTGTNAMLNFKAWYDIDPEYDYASVQVKTSEGQWTALEGNITTTENPNDETPEDLTDRNPGHGITGDSSGEWVDATFDLSAYAGQAIDLKFVFWTDSNTPEIGIYLDDIRVLMDEQIVFEDNADGENQFALNGFVQDTGKTIANHYYLLEYRDHQGIDVALTRTYYRHPDSSYNEGLVLWYIDETYVEDGDISQDHSAHPGSIAVGVIDAGQSPTIWRTKDTDEKNIDDVRYQMHDAAFSLIQEPLYKLDWGTVETIDESRIMQAVFSDGFDYTSPEMPEGGRILENYGLNAFVVSEDTEDRTMTIMLATKPVEQKSKVKIQSIKYSEETVSIKLSDDVDGPVYAVLYGENPVLDQQLVQLEKADDTFVGTVVAGYTMGMIVYNDEESHNALFNNQLFKFGVDFNEIPSTDVLTYAVRSGDTLVKIAQKFRVSMGQLKKVNNIKNPFSIKVGQVLIIPTRN